MNAILDTIAALALVGSICLPAIIAWMDAREEIRHEREINRKN